MKVKSILQIIHLEQDKKNSTLALFIEQNNIKKVDACVVRVTVDEKIISFSFFFSRQ